MIVKNHWLIYLYYLLACLLTYLLPNNSENAWQFTLRVGRQGTSKARLHGGDVSRHHDGINTGLFLLSNTPDTLHAQTEPTQTFASVWAPTRGRISQVSAKDCICDNNNFFLLFLLFITVLSKWDFFYGKFGLLPQGKPAATESRYST